MVKVGIIGMGTMGSLYAQILQQNSEADLIGVCDINKETLTSCRNKFDVPGYKNYLELFNKKNLQAVIITLPDFMHKEAALEAAKRRIHIMVEKPLATSMEDAVEMAKAVSQAGVKCQIAFGNRWNPRFVVAKRSIEENKLGEIISLRCKMNNPIFVPTKMLSWASQSSPAWFLLSHSIDLARWFTGKEAKSVFATGIKKKLIKLGIDTYDFINTLITFEGNITGNFSASWILPDELPIICDFKYEIMGSEGAIYIDGNDENIREITQNGYKSVLSHTDYEGRVMSMSSSMLSYFIKAIKNNTDCLVGIDDGMATTKIIVAIHKSIRENKPISLNSI